MEWFANEAVQQGWATCPVTEIGVIRVCAQLPGGFRPPDTTASALFLLTSNSPGWMWWPDLISPVVLPEVRSAATAKQVTDRYLLGLARRNNGRVATFDRPLAAFGGDDAVCLLPPVQ